MFPFVAVGKAAKEVFQVEMNGCLFHQNQAIHRKAQEIGLQVEYKRDPNVRKYIRRLMSIAYLPAAQIGDVFRRLWVISAEKIDSESLYNLFEYYSVNWVESATWPPSAWSVYRRYIRTNNDVEGWHNRFNRKLGRDNNPNMYTVINKLHEEATLTEIYTMCVANHLLTRDQAVKSKSKNGKLCRLWTMYDSEELSTYELLVETSNLIQIDL